MSITAELPAAGRAAASPPLTRAAYIALAGRVKLLSWLSLAWMTVEGVVALTAGSVVLMPLLGIAKQRLADQLGSAATRGEGRQNMLCAYLAGALLVGLLANALVGAWWLDGVVGLLIAGVAVKEGTDALRGDGCGCCASPLEGVIVAEDEDCQDGCCR